MKKTSDTSSTEQPSKEKAVNTDQENAGAHGGGGAPKTGDQGPKWPGGGKKGEDE